MLEMDGGRGGATGGLSVCLEHRSRSLWTVELIGGHAILLRAVCRDSRTAERARLTLRPISCLTAGLHARR